MRKQIVRFMVEIALYTAISLVLELLCSNFLGFAWLNGGSISIACVPIFIAGYKYGLKGGLLCGALVGFIQLLWSKYLLNPIQVGLDYIIPNLVCGLVGVVGGSIANTNNTKLKRILFIAISIVLAFILRIASTTISGILFWETPFWASLVYNGTYDSVNCVLNIILVIPLVFNSFIMQDATTFEN